jgi:catechol 2,3-dioxygenase-like lactoylglutathione lyase family enzyme
VRLIAFDKQTPLVRRSWDPKEPGGFAMGYPALELRPWDEAIRAAGFESRMPMSEYALPRPDGTSYGIHETIFKGPDFIHAVLISRRDGMPQLGPVDTRTGRGGPVYSTQIIECSNEVLKFYNEVLGLELRSDREFKSAGSKGALGVPDGTTFRFCIVYAPGSTSGQLLFLDFREPGSRGAGVAPRPPNRGLVMWSFPVKDVTEHERRARQAGVTVVGGPVEYESPELGPHRALTLLAPNGFLVELFDGGEGKPFAPTIQ